MVKIEFENSNLLLYPYKDILEFLKDDGIIVVDSKEANGNIEITFDNESELEKAVNASCVIPLSFTRI